MDAGRAGRAGCALRSRHVYEPDTQRVLLFGGGLIYPQLGDTWEYDGSRWRRLAVTGPSNRNGHAMAYDSVRHRAVLFGGSSVHQPDPSDTWEWDGGAGDLVAVGGPPARAWASRCFDA